MSKTFRGNTPEPDTNDTLPSGWREASLAEVAEIRISNVDKKSAVGEIPIRLCNYIDVYKNVYITAALDFMEATATPSEIARFGVELGDVMITKDSETPDDIGVPAVAIWTEQKLVCGYHLALFKPHKDQIDSVFLAKQLRLPRLAAYYGRLACGSTRYGLSNSGIARTPLRLPPLSQQRKIARILTTVDNLIEKTEALIAKYQAIKQGMMHDLFTRGVDEHGHLRPPYEEAPELYKQSELGWIPKEWGTDELHNRTLQIIDGTHFTPIYTEEGVPFLRVTDIQEETINFEELKFVSEQEHRILCQRCLPQRGDILLSKNGTIGIPKIVDWDWPFSIFVSLALIRPKHDQIETRFLYYILLSNIVWEQIRRRSKQGTVTNLHLEEIRELVVPLPETAEQKRITASLDAMNCMIRSEQSLLTKLRLRKTGLMQDLLTGKVRVKTDEAEEVVASA